MAVKSPARIEREVLVTYLQARWLRSELAKYTGSPPVPDPGHGEDEISPVVYYGQPFDPDKESDLSSLSAYAARELRGYGYFEIAVTSGAWNGQTLPINLIDGDWILDSPGGPVQVYPQSDMEDGASVTFRQDSGETFTGGVTATWLHGVGYLVINLMELGQPEKLDRGSAGAYESRTRMSVMIAAPPSTGPALADQYAGACAALLRRLRIRGDSGGTPGSLEVDMGDSGVQYIYQTDRDAVPERANYIGERDGWAWYLFRVIFRRIYKLVPAGLQPVTPA